MSVISETLDSFLREFGGSSLGQQASFRGVPFVTETENDEEFGRRLAIHDYPNSNKRYAEDVGGFAGRFTVSGCVIGNDATVQFERLKAACSQKGPGELVLSILGSYTVTCGACKATCSTSDSFEKITFELEFFLSEETATAKIDQISGDSVFTATDDFFDSLNNYFKENFSFLKSDIVAALMKGDLLTVCNSLLSMTGFINPSDLNNIQKIINTIKKNASVFKYQAENLSEMLFGEYGAWRIILNSAWSHGGVNAIPEFADIVTNYGSTLSTNPAKLLIPASTEQTNKNNSYLWPETTEHRKERNKQRLMLMHAHKLSALAIGYSILANVEYNTSDDATEARDILETAYINLVHGQTAIQPSDKIFSPAKPNGYILHENANVINSFEKIRVLSIKSMENLFNIAYRVQEYQLKSWQETSILNIAYLSQAENLNNEDDLMALTDKLADENREILTCKGTIRILV